MDIVRIKRIETNDPTFEVTIVVSCVEARHESVQQSSIS